MMKSFKKWWDKFIQTEKLQGSSYFEGTKAGWRAALKEALKHSDASLVYPDSAIVGWIMKELEGE